MDQIDDDHLPNLDSDDDGDPDDLNDFDVPSDQSEVLFMKKIRAANDVFAKQCAEYVACMNRIQHHTRKCGQKDTRATRMHLDSV
jgi:hypothetical protein